MPRRRLSHRPRPGRRGRRRPLLYSGPPDGIAALPAGSGPTRDFLAGDAPPCRCRRRGARGGACIAVSGARMHNLRGIDVRFALGAFNVVTGVSGAGKATLVKRILASRLREGVGARAPTPLGSRSKGGSARSSRSTSRRSAGRRARTRRPTRGSQTACATSSPACRRRARRGFGKGRFSFNVEGGRCEACQGAGLIQIGMHFLGDVDVVCPECGGRRFNDETLEVAYRGRTIHDVLEMSVEPRPRSSSATTGRSDARSSDAMVRLGLGYLRLGQSSTTLSGGEAQRVKLAAELGRPGAGETLYILEEPTTGLHPHDVAMLLASLQELVDKGNTIVAIEHHPDFVAAADLVVDLGPGSGAEGGRVVVAGPPEVVAAEAASSTGRALAAGPRRRRPAGRARRAVAGAERDRRSAASPIRLEGVTTHNLRGIDVSIPFERLTVDLRPVGLRQVLARLRHALRRGPADATSRASRPTCAGSSPRRSGRTWPGRGD